MSGADTRSSTSAETFQTSKFWHYSPPLPIQVSHYFRKPFSFSAALKWMFSSWFPISDRLIVLGLAVLSWLFFHPEIEACKEFALGWVSQIYLRNLLLLMLVAGGLHLYFYVWRKQGDDLRYDKRPLVRDNKKFTFNSQVLDNMFWSIASGVTIWSGYEIMMMWSMANGYLPMLIMPQDWPWLILLLFLVPIWETFYFFLIHRLIHWPPLYRTVHHLHHRNTNVAPWSGMSMHPVEHLIFLGSVLIHFIVPVSPLLLIFHLQYFTLTAITTHTGYRGIKFGDRLILPLGTFHHQIHHRFFECNYGGLEIPMDQWAGSFHDGTDQSHQQFMQKQRQKVREKRKVKSRG